MSDLIERLRYAEWLWPASPPDDGTYAEAADEIERLTAQVESLQNKWASRELSQQDSDALMAENKRLTKELRDARAAIEHNLNCVHSRDKRIAKLEAVVDYVTAGEYDNARLEIAALETT